jgi:hypothetical protein
MIIFCRFTPKDNVKQYNIWGAALAEVEVDILTGEKQVILFITGGYATSITRVLCKLHIIAQ